MQGYWTWKRDPGSSASIRYLWKEALLASLSRCHGALCWEGVYITSSTEDAWLTWGTEYKGSVGFPKHSARGWAGPKKKGLWRCQGTGSRWGLLWFSALSIWGCIRREVLTNVVQCWSLLSYLLSCVETSWSSGVTGCSCSPSVKDIVIAQVHFRGSQWPVLGIHDSVGDTHRCLNQAEASGVRKF